jgi:hypothetical protein
MAPDAFVMQIEGGALQLANANMLGGGVQQIQVQDTASTSAFRRGSGADQTKTRGGNLTAELSNPARLRAFSETLTMHQAARARTKAAAAGASDTAGQFEDQKPVLSTLSTGMRFKAAGQPGASNSSRLYAGPNSLSQPVQNSLVRRSTPLFRRRSLADTSEGTASGGDNTLSTIFSGDAETGDRDARLPLQIQIQQQVAAGSIFSMAPSRHMTQAPGRGTHQSLQGIEILHKISESGQSRDLSHEGQQQQQAATICQQNENSTSAAAVAAATDAPGVEASGLRALPNDKGKNPPAEFAPADLQHLAHQLGGQHAADEALLASVSAAGFLTLQQQQLFADLLRLRQLVNKAAARMDQRRLDAFLDAAAANELEVSSNCNGCLR